MCVGGSNIGNTNLRNKKAQPIANIFDPSGGVANSFAISEYATLKATGQSTARSKVIVSGDPVEPKKKPDPVEQQSAGYKASLANQAKRNKVRLGLLSTKNSQSLLN